MFCQACNNGDHHLCGMQTWCECDCEGPDGLYLPLTAEEAERAYDEAPEVPLSDERIRKIVDYATSGPSLTPQERAAMDSLPPDFVTHLLAGERAVFNPDGTFKEWSNVR